MEDTLGTLSALISQRLVPLGEAIGSVASWKVYDLSLLPKDRALINSRVLKYASLTNNLTKMIASIYNLYQDPNYQPFFVSEVVNSASRLTWIMLYFYGAMAHYSLWIFGQTEVKSVAQMEGSDWITFLQNLGNFFTVLASLPKTWLEQGINIIIDDIEREQMIPAESPLELVVQIYLMVHDAANHIKDPDAVQANLRQIAIANHFPANYDLNNHDGFSNCIFVTQSNLPERSLIVGSTVMYMGYVNIPALTINFTALRRRRFIQGINQYDEELKARFRNKSDTDFTTPERRYQAVGYTRNAAGTALANFQSLVRVRLIEEYAGRKPTPMAPNQVPFVLPLVDRKKWAPFSYARECARSNFAPIIHAKQRNWFEPTPRCMKCRVIHDYNIMDEDLQVKAIANKSCQCAEDIVYVKLRQLNKVGNVILADL